MKDNERDHNLVIVEPIFTRVSQDSIFQVILQEVRASSNSRNLYAKR